MKATILTILNAILRDQLKIVALLERLIALLTGRMLRLIIEGDTMDVIQGKTATYVVTCYDSQTPPVAVHDTGRTIAPTVSAGSAANNADGTGGVFTAPSAPFLGDVTLTATDGTLTSAPHTWTVVADPALAPASLVVTSP